MDDRARERLAQIAPMQQALSVVWTALEKHLRERKADLVLRLVSKNDDEVRGRIKEIDDLLELPERLQQEAVSLQQPQQEEAELP
jgi:hypothetical protein